MMTPIRFFMLYLTIFIIGFTKCVDAKQPAPPAGYEAVRTATITAFDRYAGRRSALGDQLNKGRLNGEEFLLKLSEEIKRIDTRPTSPLLKDYFQMVLDENKALFPAAQQLAKEMQATEAAQDMSSSMAGDDPFSAFLSMGINEQLNQNLNAKWQPVIDQIKNLHQPRLKAQLKALTEEFDYPFYSIEYEKH